jgi:hypothetical protein
MKWFFFLKAVKNQPRKTLKTLCIVKIVFKNKDKLKNIFSPTQIGLSSSRF